MKRYFYIAYLFLLLVVPVGFVILPINFFDTGQSVCLSSVFFDVSCYACGMTRALKHLICFDFSTAWEYNKLAFATLPLIIWLWVVEVFRVKNKLKK
ncbi:MAG: DUF2752 domain-containing protein [Crocinitomicaceae bacterium]|nr:DUF2752 domain-containing protein [Crocinitomicaceae bacterium]